MLKTKKHTLLFQVFNFLVVLCNVCPTPQDEDRYRNSIYQVSPNQILLGKAMEVFYSSVDILCAQRCSSTSRCLSFNYHPSEGMCELHSGVENGEKTILVFRQGYTFSKKLSS